MLNAEHEHENENTPRVHHIKFTNLLSYYILNIFTLKVIINLPSSLNLSAHDCPIRAVKVCAYNFQLLDLVD